MDEEKLEAMLEEMDDDELEAYFEELCKKIANDEKYHYPVFEFYEGSVFFIVTENGITEMPNDASSSPRGGWFPRIVTCLSEDEEKMLSELMEKYHIPSWDYFDGIPDYYDDEDVYEWCAKEDENFDAIFDAIEKDIENDEFPYESIAEFGAELSRHGLDDCLYYMYEGEFIDFYDNVGECGEEAGSYSGLDITDWIKILNDIDSYIVTAH